MPKYFRISWQQKKKKTGIRTNMLLPVRHKQ
ncbi:hypothetical protein [Flavobacterium caseinilyticum]